MNRALKLPRSPEQGSYGGETRRDYNAQNTWAQQRSKQAVGTAPPPRCGLGLDLSAEKHAVGTAPPPRCALGLDLSSGALCPVT